MKIEVEISARELYKGMHELCNIRVGDYVRVLRAAETSEMGWGAMWIEAMNDYVGNIYKVTDTKLIEDGYNLKNPIKEENNYSFPFFVLEKVQLVYKKGLK